LKSDNGGEYCDSRFEEFYANQIKRVKTVSENSHQNRGDQAHEEDYSRACQEHANTRSIGQTVLDICS